MKTWGSALFPLGVLVTLAGMTFWLRYATELPEPRHDGKHRHDPDFIISDATLRKLDLTGTLKYTMKAEEIRHFPDDDSTEISRPSVASLRPNKPTITVSAERGTVSRDGVQVDLYGDVQVHRPASAKDEALAAYAPQLTVLPDDGKAFTKEPVLITKGEGSWLKGVGLRVDTQAQTYVLESQASALLQSKHAKKKP